MRAQKFWPPRRRLGGGARNFTRLPHRVPSRAGNPKRGRVPAPGRRQLFDFGRGEDTRGSGGAGVIDLLHGVEGPHLHPCKGIQGLEYGVHLVVVGDIVSKLMERDSAAPVIIKLPEEPLDL